MPDYTQKQGWVKTYNSEGEQTWTRKNTWKANTQLPAHPLNGRAAPTVDLSQSAQKVLPYATGLLAQSRADNKEDLRDHTFKNLAVGTESMDHARTAMDKGRGNVDANDPLFPEAHYRTAQGYKRKKQEKLNMTQFAAQSELMRAGNCDMHASVTYTHSAAHMDDSSIAAKVRIKGHTFSELRGPQGATQVGKEDVVVDSWAGGSHAVLRQDSYFATGISASKDRSVEQRTQLTKDKTKGASDYQQRQQYIASNQQLKTDMNVQAASHHVDPKNPITRGLWLETGIMSKQGQKAVESRQKTFEAGGKFLMGLQTVFAARKMGASVGGAAKLVKK